MDIYTKASYRTAQLFTEQYSTSFSASCRLFPSAIRRDIYAIYGLVRVADEIVDTYSGDDQRAQLDALETEVSAASARQYSANPLVHAFALTAERYGLTDELVRPFFESMRMDIGEGYTQASYDEYIYGSAEVVGLMCLRVFVNGDDTRYEALSPGAKSLGAAYQKVNFLRDIAADHALGRMYFPDVIYETFDDAGKQAIEADIAEDFAAARDYIDQLPSSARAAVRLSYDYYKGLLDEIRACSAAALKSRRIRVADSKKLRLLIAARLKTIGSKT